MIKNDFRYIIKRILIGIGIILGISMVKSCNVYAQVLPTGYSLTQLTSSPQQQPHSVGDTYNFEIAGYDYTVEYRSTGLYVNNHLVSSDTNVLYHNWVIGKWSGNSTVTFYYIYAPVNSGNPTGNARLYLQNITNFNGNFPVHVDTMSTDYSTNYRKRVNFTNGSFTSENTSQTSYCSGGYCSFLSGYNFDVYGFADYAGFVFSSSNTTYYRTDFSNPIYNYPEIVDLNPTLNEDDNVLVSVSFAPEFSFIDTQNYNYYAWFDGYDKLSLTQNNVQLNTQNNTTFFVEIRDKQDNLIDSETYTVSRIGQFDVSEYQILFSMENYTESDTNNENVPVDIINRVDIDMLFMPKSPYLKYQYQFVKEEESLTDNWITINPESSSDLSKNDYVFTTHDNGTLYARIVDLDGVLQYSSTYTITIIGDINYYVNDTGVGGFFNKIITKLDYSGPISSLISVPVRLFSSLLTESSKSCTPYTFGNLLGSDITFTCVNVENYIGSNLYHLLDLLMSFGLVLGIIHFIKKQYNKFTSLNDKNDDIM